ncbi:hypothetical protein Tco_1011270, partial [Tanacetum coccineum]
MSFLLPPPLRDGPRFSPLSLMFFWRMFLNKLHTRTNLSNRGLDIPCTLSLNCGIGVEPRNHLFSHARWLWICFVCLVAGGASKLPILTAPLPGKCGSTVLDSSAFKSLHWKPFFLVVVAYLEIQEHDLILLEEASQRNDLQQL